jgi:hypothetical protein
VRTEKGKEEYTCHAAANRYESQADCTSLPAFFLAYNEPAAAVPSNTSCHHKNLTNITEITKAKRKESGFRSGCR